MELVELYEIIINNNISNIKELTKLELTSDSTLRRMLNTLKESGFIELKFGGHIDVIDKSVISISDDFKKNMDIANKRRLGKMCVEHINDGDIIFIDNGTTVRFILPHLKNKNVVIYSNGYNHIEVAKKYELDFRIIPGTILYKEASIVGEEAIDYLANINFDVTFIGANGFNEQYGVTTPNMSEAIIKRRALMQARHGFIVIDSKKYGSVFKHKICDFKEYPVITLPIS